MVPDPAASQASLHLQCCPRVILLTCCTSAVDQELPGTARLSLLGIRGPCRQLERNHSALAIAVEALLLPKASAHGA